MSQFLSGLYNQSASNPASSLLNPSNFGLGAPTSPYPPGMENLPQYGKSIYPVALYNANPNYLVEVEIVNQAGLQYNIVASLPDTFAMAVDASWAPFLPGGDITTALGLGYGFVTHRNSSFVEPLLRQGGRSVGLSGQIPILGQLTWQENHPLSIMLPLQFNATYDTMEEVLKPIVQLLMLISPSLNTKTGTLVPPGPTISGVVSDLKSLSFNSNFYDITLHIGASIKMRPMVVANVVLQFDTMVDKNGDFVSIQADTTFITPQVVTVDTIKQMFNVTDQQMGVSNSNYTTPASAGQPQPAPSTPPPTPNIPANQPGQYETMFPYISGGFSAGPPG